MSRLRDNIVANYAGNIWQSLMAVVFVPVYIHFMGAESYGLIGIFTSLQAILIILDMGIGATLTREMARLSVLPGKHRNGNLARSLEVICWCIAVFVGVLVTGASPLIAHYWVKPGQLSVHTVQLALLIMGFGMVLQWPASFYSGGLTGLQRQVLLNTINNIMSTLRGGGAVLVLWLISPTIYAFFTWQIVMSAINTLILAFLLWRSLPFSRKKASFDKPLLAGIVV